MTNLSSGRMWKVQKSYSFGTNVDCMAYLYDFNNEMVEQRELSNHCLACAKAEIMSETGIPADMRGWHKQGLCGSFAMAMSMALEQEQEEDE